MIPNFGDWRRYRSTVTPWLKYVSGGMEEHFTKYGDSPADGQFTGADWDDQLAVLKQVQSMGKLFLGVAHSSLRDHAAARYGWATMLLAAQGSASFALHDDYTRETWFPEYGYDLGAPRGRESKDAAGIHRRAFARGLVLVNPTKERSVVRFGGRYRGSGLGAARATVMRPHTGLVLLAAGARASAGATALAPRAARCVRRRARPLPRPRTLRARAAARSPSRSARGRRVVVGRRKVAVRRTAHVRVAPEAARATLRSLKPGRPRSRPLRVSVRARAELPSYTARRRRASPPPGSAPRRRAAAVRAERAPAGGRIGQQVDDPARERVAGTTVTGSSRIPSTGC